MAYDYAFHYNTIGTDTEFTLTNFNHPKYRYNGKNRICGAKRRHQPKKLTLRKWKNS